MGLEKPAIQINGLYKIYGASPVSALDRIRTGPGSETEAGVFVALKNINLTVETGKICVIWACQGAASQRSCGASTDSSIPRQEKFSSAAAKSRRRTKKSSAIFAPR
jgi:hypothetical protein